MSKNKVKHVLIALLIYVFIPICTFGQAGSRQFSITGTITDKSGEPLVGALIKVAGTNTAATANANGQYNLSFTASDPSINVTYVGFKPTVLKITRSGEHNIVMEEDENVLGEAVVQAGIIQRDRLGFTGAYKTVTQAEIKSVGNINLLQSLKSLDPSFIVNDNMAMGSDPNTMLNIEVRGQTTMGISEIQDEAAVSAANRPLFILNGFEASIQQINDLDVNRVESLTILKDAGSTAIYGAKGANGVIVIETVKPKSGEIMVRYDADLQLSFPDLSVYNLMNAKEKLEFERLAGRYGTIDGVTDLDKSSYYNNYYRRLELVSRGIDTYWLGEPVRNAVTHSHSVSVSGGEKNLMFDVGANYRDYNGVIKDSYRETFGTDVQLRYRSSNKLNISNHTTVSGTNAYTGAWGSFSDFARVNPYYTKRNEDGTIPRTLESPETGGNVTVYNPLYNASLDSRKDDRTFYFTNNTQVNWYITQNFHLSGALSLGRNSGSVEDYMDPRHTRYTNTDYTKKGLYSGSNSSSWYYSANARANYLYSIDKKHNFTAILRGAIEERNSNYRAFTAEGFPDNSNGIPSFAYSYTENSRPSYSKSVSRSASSLIALNYNFLYRYIVDFNYNIEGSTTFGRNKRFQDFWSVGLGWNISKEEFAKDLNWLNELRITGNTGTNANQNVSAVTESVYSFYVGNTQFGQGAYLSQFANPNLEWQQVKKKSLNLDGTFFDKKFTVIFSAYISNTDPMVVSLDQKPSSGISKYPMNLGNMETKGLDFSLIYYPIRNVKENIYLNFRLTGAVNRATYGGFANALEGLNQAFLDGTNARDNLRSLQRYEDGRSPHDIWAVRSAGIDPATGREIFLTKDGVETFRYNVEDRVVVGNTRPDIEGVFGFSLIYKKLQVNSTIRYRLGKDVFNTDLYNKVENISSSTVGNNQDKRALYDRWQRVGDIAKFRSIALTTASEVSSRFVQKEDMIRGESIRVSWDFSRDKWAKSLKLRDLKIGFSMNDIFTVSTVKIERGIDYPFQRAINCNLSARF